MILVLPPLFGILLFLVYCIPYKLGWKKLGIVLCSSLVLLFTFAFFSDALEELFFNKEDAKQHLCSLQVNLKDDFEMLNNECSNNLDVSYRKFELKISDWDKQSIIQKIKNTENYKDSVYSNDYMGIQVNGGTKKVIGYKTSKYFILRSYDPDNTFPNATIQVNILGNTLYYMCALGD